MDDDDEATAEYEEQVVFHFPEYEHTDLFARFQDYEVKDLHTEKPLIRIGPYLFIGRWDNPETERCPTNMLFSSSGLHSFTQRRIVFLRARKKT